MNIWDSLDRVVDESLKLTRQAYDKARELGTLSTLELKRKKLEYRAHRACARLGLVAHRLLREEKKRSVSLAHAEVKLAVAEIDAVRAALADLDEQILAVRRGTGKPEAKAKPAAAKSPAGKKRPAATAKNRAKKAAPPKA